jgi:hypothetical protein
MIRINAKENDDLSLSKVSYLRSLRDYEKGGNTEF